MTNNQTSKHENKEVPRHIAIIMDGNGRWATGRKLPRAEGHRRGANSLREAVRSCVELGVRYLSVFAFSTENWNRPRAEVAVLMELLAASIDRELDELDRNGVRVRFLGRLNMLPEKLRKKIENVHEVTRGNDTLNLNIMISYGGRAEIVDAVKNLMIKAIAPEDVSEDSISGELYTAGMPDPDLLIRTAGEMRVSNFMLWQIAYSELFVTDTLWPDFGKKHLLEAIESYNKRVRKFGCVGQK